ncbi:MAG TPA: phosphotransferase [Miltoncostaeaceae bacterium]|nr:phosphotransferase [Miltoncostaeaceae bacterium]
MPGRPPRGPPPAGPFAFLHGDLVAANVLWPPQGGPVLIDWEFQRMGDPAEDLAYLAELNALPDAVLAAVLEGYGEPGVAARVEGWRGLVAADAGAWYLGQGMRAEAERMLARARGRAATA